MLDVIWEMRNSRTPPNQSKISPIYILAKRGVLYPHFGEVRAFPPAAFLPRTHIQLFAPQAPAWLKKFIFRSLEILENHERVTASSFQVLHFVLQLCALPSSVLREWEGMVRKKNKMNGVRIESVNFLFNLCPCFSVDLMLYYAQNTLHSGHDLNVKPSKCEWWAHNSFNLVIWPVRPREGTIPCGMDCSWQSLAGKVWVEASTCASQCGCSRPHTRCCICLNKSY